MTAKVTSKRTFGIVLNVLLFVLMANLLGCASPKYVHTVFFDFKPGTPAEQIDTMVDDSNTMLVKVPSVRKVECGRRDVNAARKVNDTEFDVGLVVYFDDKAGYDEYEVHPDHRRMVDKHKANFAGVRVCDFIAK